MTSAVAYIDPLDMGSYGVGYAVGKAGLFKAAGILAVELGDRGLRAYNVHPGFIRTERMELHVADQEGLDLTHAAPPEVCGEVMAWLADDPTEDPPVNGSLMESQAVLRRARPGRRAGRPCRPAGGRSPVGHRPGVSLRLPS